MTESRLKGGTLTIDSIQFAAQATSVQLVVDSNEVGDNLEVLSGETQTPEEEYSWELRITAIQDFDNPAGFVEFCTANAGEIVTYSWRPNATGVTASGTCRIRPVSWGGDVNKRLDTPAVFPCQQTPTRTYPAP